VKAKTIALLVDNPYRDLPGLVLTGMQLCQQGYTCLLVPLNLRNWEIWSLAPDFILLNYLKKNSEDFVRAGREAGMRFGVLDTEGGVFSSIDFYGGEISRDESVRRSVDCICTWGPRIGRYITEGGLFSKEQVSVTGCPRFDFYAHPWREASLRASSYADEYKRPLVLINSLFTLANPAFEDPEEEARGVAAFQGRPEEEVFGWQRSERETMRGFVDLTNQLAERFPQATFIYRPHPFERLSTYSSMLAKRSNLFLVKKGTVDGWLLRASALIQQGCSTATEAAMVGIPALYPKWVPTWVANPTAEGVSIPCESLDEMSDRLESIFAGRPNIPAYVQDKITEITSDFFLSIDGKSHQRVAETVGNSMSRTEDISLEYCSRAIDGVAGSGVPLGRQMRSFARRALGRSVHWSFSQLRDVFEPGWEQSDKYFGLQEVHAIAESIQPLASKCSRGRWSNVAVRRASDVASYRFGYLHGRSIALKPA
jgi:surface carbohydrate biosynthesis protein